MFDFFKKSKGAESQKKGLTKREVITNKKLLGKKRRPVRFLGLVIERKDLSSFLAAFAGGLFLSILFVAVFVGGLLSLESGIVPGWVAFFLLVFGFFPLVIAPVYLLILAFEYSTKKLVAIETLKKMRHNRRQFKQDKPLIEALALDLDDIIDADPELLVKFRAIFRDETGVLPSKVMDRLKELLVEHQDI